MARLLINPGAPGSWEIHLKIGTNSLGRDDTNDFTLPDPSVSRAHCQILVGDNSVVIKDLGSTNGTYVNRAQVKEAVLRSGQTIHLGSVQMVYQADTPATATPAAPKPAPVAAKAKPITVVLPTKPPADSK